MRFRHREKGGNERKKVEGEETRRANLGPGRESGEILEEEEPGKWPF